MPLIANIGKATIAHRIKRRSARKGAIRFGVGLIATRIATRSIPGAVLVGGALVARTLYQRREMAKANRYAHNSHPSSTARHHQAAVLLP